MKKVLLSIAAFIAALAGGYGANELVGTYRLNLNEVTVMNEVATTTVGTTIGVADQNNIGVTVATTAASGTLKFACSMADNEPTFSTSSSATNRWDYVEMVDLEDGSAIDGDTGLTLANTTDVRQFELNVNSFKWCTANLSSWTAGTTTVKFLRANNQ